MMAGGDINTIRCLQNVATLCRQHLVIDNGGMGNCMFLAMDSGSNNNSDHISRVLLTTSMRHDEHMFGFDGYGGMGSTAAGRGFTSKEARDLDRVSGLLEQSHTLILEQEKRRIFEDVYLAGMCRDGTWGSDRELQAMAHYYWETRGTIITLPKVKDPSKDFQGIQHFCADSKVYCLSFPEFFEKLDVAKEEGGEEVYFTFEGERTQVLLSTQGTHYERLQPSPGILD